MNKEIEKYIITAWFDENRIYAEEGGVLSEYIIEICESTSKLYNIPYIEVLNYIDKNFLNVIHIKGE